MGEHVAAGNRSNRPGVRSSGGLATAATRRRPAPQQQQRSHQQRLIQCPLCGRNFSKSVIEIHAAQCEGRSTVDSSATPAADSVEVLEVKLPPENGDKSSSTTPPPRHLRPKTSKPSSDGSLSSYKMVECPICNQKYSKSVIEEHAALCGEEVYV
jgi:hypothetical protein